MGTAERSRIPTINAKALLLAMVLLGCSGPTDAQSGPSGTTVAALPRAEDATATIATGPPGPQPSEPMPSERAGELVSMWATELPVAEAVLPCVAERLDAGSPGVDEVSSMSEADARDALMTLAGDCMAAQRALPAWIDSLEAVAGSLSEAQQQCLAEGFEQLPPAALEAARVEALGGEADSSSDQGLRKVIESCDVEVGG